MDADGHVSRVEVIASGGDELDQAAVVAARQWTFTPAMRGRQPVASKIRVPFHFAPPAPAPELVPAPPAGGGVTGASGGAGSAPTEGLPAEAAPVAPAPAAPPPAEGPARPVAPPSESVTVVGRAPPPSRGASDYHVRVGALGEVPRKDASELLKLAPGVFLTSEGGAGHAERVYLRGFDAREGQDIEFSVGGVPVNESGNLHGSGFADLHFILPELVESLRVLEGPFDPRQGNYAVAGSAEYELGLAKRGLTMQYLRGSFGTERILALYGPEGESAHTFGGAELYRTDGFGANRDAQRATAMGQYEGALGERGTWRVAGAAYGTTYHSAGYVREDDWKAGRIGYYGTYDPSQGGDAQRYQLSADLETKSGGTTFQQGVFFVTGSNRVRQNFTGFLLDAQTPLQQPHAQRGDLLDVWDERTTVGARGFARTRGEALGQSQELELGWFARGDRAHGTQQRVESATGVPYRTEVDLVSQLGDIGLWGDASLRAAPWLALRGGLRADLFTYDVLDACAVHGVSRPSASNPPGDASCLDQQAFGRHREPNQRSSTASVATMPRASLVVGPFRGVTFSASAGAGVRSIDPIYVTQDVKTPFARIAAYEAGAAWAGGGDAVEATARATLFTTHVDRDLVFSETAGRNVLGGGTRRSGAALAARVSGKFFDQNANVTVVRSAFDDGGLLVPYVPDLVVRSDSALFAKLPARIAGTPLEGKLGAGIGWVGRRALPYDQRSDTIFTVDGSASVAWRNIALGVLGTNLLDRRYRLAELQYVSDFHSQPGATLVPARHFVAGAPRAIYFTLTVTVGDG
jgi:TonB family protein